MFGKYVCGKAVVYFTKSSLIVKSVDELFSYAIDVYVF